MLKYSGKFCVYKFIQMARTIYRVVDVFANTSDDLCYIYIRDRDGTLNVAKIRCIYEVIAGCKNPRINPRVAMQDIVSKHTGKISVRNLGVSKTYYRGRWPLISLFCTDYHTYVRVCDYIRYEQEGVVFRCNAYSTVEATTLMRNNLYGRLYVVVSDGKLEAARDDEHFPYTPKVAGFDLEMSNLDPADPDSDLYLAAYYRGGKYSIVYTRSYFPHEIASTENRTYFAVNSRAELAYKLSEIVADDVPDVLTGYNIYNADIPALYHALRKELMQWYVGDASPSAYYHNTKRLEKKYIDSETGLAVKIPGVQTVDMYAYLSKMLRVDDRTSLRLDDVSREYLKDSKHPIDYRELMRIYHSGSSDEKLRVMHYCAHDAKLPVKLYEHFNVDNYYCGNYTLTGISAQEAITHGDVATTYGMCYKEAYLSGLYMDDPNMRVFKPGGGLVLDGKKGYYENVDCVDLSSLYPSIMIQHNIDSTSMLSRQDTQVLLGAGVHTRANVVSYYSISAADNNIHILSNKHGAPVGFCQSESGLFPTVLKKTLALRANLKQQIAAADAAGDSAMSVVLAGRELAAKTVANSTCGALAEQTIGNPISCCELNDILTTTGRGILSLAKHVAEAMGILVIYGDTDSLFVQSHGRTQQFIDRMHSMLPEHIRFKLEYTASKFLVGSKKHYIALVSGRLKIMGYKAAKSSKCVAAKQLFMYLVDILFEYGVETALAAYNHAVDAYASEQSVDVRLLSHTLNYRGKSYKPGSHMYKMVTAMKSRGVDLAPGNSKQVITVYTYQEYLHIYNREPSVNLPDESSYVSERIYTLDEIGDDHTLVNIRKIINSQCGSDLDSVVNSYMHNWSQC
jgi:DNA polymerase elongation subunit (family B)